MIRGFISPIALGPRRFGIAGASVIAAIVLVTYFTLLSGFSGARDYLYGGPIPIGRCHADFVFFGQNACDSGVVAWMLYVADVMIVAILLAITGERGGPAALVLAALAALIAIQLAPRDARGSVIPVVSWLFILLVGTLAAFIAPPRGPGGLRVLLRELRRRTPPLIGGER